MRKVLFIDRDGTLVKEPSDCQLDNLEKLEFFPGVFQNMASIAKKLDYELVMVTNQDGLGTDSFPEEIFWPAHKKILKAFENEGVVFNDVLIDRTFPHENAPTRKPKTGKLTKYLSGNFDLENSYVIGDRLTDMELAKNMGAMGIWINTQPDPGKDELFIENEKLSPVIVLETSDWFEIYRYLRTKQRSAIINRKTGETDIKVELSLDGEGRSDISTGIGFLNHMIHQIAKHSGVDLTIHVKGDLDVDEHHTTEDTALALGEAFYKALCDKSGIERYGFCLPMDDCLAQVALDFGGRSWIVWEAEFRREKIGEMPTEMFFHFFKSFSDSAKCNLNIKAEGKNEHHKIEAIFKAFSRAIKMAIQREENNINVPSTKGLLE